MRHLSVLLMLVPLVLVGCSKPQPAEEPIRAVRTLTVDTSAVGGVHEYAAEVRARTESRLSFRVGGKMTRRMVDVGQSVKAGQALAQIDPQDLKLSQQAAQAALNAASANLELSEAEYKRFKELRDQGFISGWDLERREANLKAMRAQAEQARAQAGVQGNQAAYATLVADASGVITGVDAEPGAVVAAGAPILRLAHDGPRDVVFNVAEDRIAGLRALLGKPDAITVQPWGQGEAPISATVREVAAAADPVTRTFAVKADLGKAQLRLGQTATVAVAAPTVDGLIKLPLQAVFESQGKSAVWVLDRATMTVQSRPVQVAGADANMVVISQGLASGQTVVSAGVHALTQGQKVRLYAEPLLAKAPSAVVMPASVPASR